MPGQLYRLIVLEEVERFFSFPVIHHPKVVENFVLFLDKNNLKDVNNDAYKLLEDE